MAFNHIIHIQNHVHLYMVLDMVSTIYDKFQSHLLSGSHQLVLMPLYTFKSYDQKLEFGKMIVQFNTAYSQCGPVG